MWPQFGGLCLRRRRKIKRINAGVSRMPSEFKNAEEIPFTYNEPSPDDLERRKMQRDMNVIKSEIGELRRMFGCLMEHQQQETHRHRRESQGAAPLTLHGDDPDDNLHSANGRASGLGGRSTSLDGSVPPTTSLSASRRQSLGTGSQEICDSQIKTNKKVRLAPM
jgi:hypothetical protein